MPFPNDSGLTGIAAQHSAREPAAEEPAPASRAMPAGRVSKHEGPGPEKTVPLPAPVPGGWRGFDASRVARLHALYYDPDVRVGAIAKVFGVSTSTLLRWIEEMEWPSRRQMRRDSIAALRAQGAELHAQWSKPEVLPARDAGRVSAGLDALTAEGAGNDTRPGAATGTEPFAPARTDAPGLLRSIEDQIRAEIALMRARMGDTSAGAGERNARTLASLVRTLRAMRALREADGPGGDAVSGDEPAPRSLAELREDLAARLAKLRAESGQG